VVFVSQLSMSVTIAARSAGKWRDDDGPPKYMAEDDPPSNKTQHTIPNKMHLGTVVVSIVCARCRISFSANRSFARAIPHTTARKNKNKNKRMRCGCLMLFLGGSMVERYGKELL